MAQESGLIDALRAPGVATWLDGASLLGVGDTCRHLRNAPELLAECARRAGPALHRARTPRDAFRHLVVCDRRRCDGRTDGWRIRGLEVPSYETPVLCGDRASLDGGRLAAVDRWGVSVYDLTARRHQTFAADLNGRVDGVRVCMRGDALAVYYGPAGPSWDRVRACRLIQVYITGADADADATRHVASFGLDTRGVSGTHCVCWTDADAVLSAVGRQDLLCWDLGDGEPRCVRVSLASGCRAGCLALTYAEEHRLAVLTSLKHTDLYDMRVAAGPVVSVQHPTYVRGAGVGGHHTLAVHRMPNIPEPGAGDFVEAYDLRAPTAPRARLRETGVLALAGVVRREGGDAVCCVVRSGERLVARELCDTRQAPDIPLAGAAETVGVALADEARLVYAAKGEGLRVLEYAAPRDGTWCVVA